MKHLFFSIKDKTSDSDGHYKMAAVRKTGGDYPMTAGEAQKYMLDIVAHALAISQGSLELDVLQCADLGDLLDCGGDYLLVRR